MAPDLKTTYLGMDLKSPVGAAASPMCGDVDTLRRLEDHGAGLVTLPSLFEEQIEHAELEVQQLYEFGAESYGEATNYFPELDTYNTGPGRYLKLIEEAKAALDIPVVASLNGTTKGGWVHHAKLIESAGADAVELNIYYIPTDPQHTADHVERRYAELVSAVKEEVSIPIAVKLSPFFSAPAHMAERLVEAGASGLVLFNRFMHPDIDLDSLRVTPEIHLSTSEELLLRLRWIAILRPWVKKSIAATGGAHTSYDVLKLLLVGADLATMASALFLKGPEHIARVNEEIGRWMEEHEYASVEQMKGSMSHASSPDPEAFERGNYMKTLTSYSSEVV